MEHCGPSTGLQITSSRNRVAVDEFWARRDAGMKRHDVWTLAEEWGRRGFSRREFFCLLGNGAGAATIAGILGAGGGLTARLAGVTGDVPTTAAATAQRGGNLVAAGTGEMELDPYYQQARTWIIQGQFYSALFDYLGPDPFKIHGQLAESWNESDRELTVKIRQGVKFHNGREVTAQDVVDNINRALDKSVGHYL